MASYWLPMGSLRLQPFCTRQHRLVAAAWPARATSFQAARLRKIPRSSAVSSSCVCPASSHVDVLLIDGTNLACIAARHTRAGLPLPACFLAWLKYVMNYTTAKRCICAFDNKGNDRQGIRASILPGYLASRHRRAGARPTSAQHQQKKTHDHVHAAPHRSDPGKNGQSRRLTCYHKLHSSITSAGVLPLLADDGYEADDTLGCLVEALQSLHPSLTITIVSSDSDMQQLISDRVTWLEVLDAPTAAQPLGLHHHGLESFVDSYGFHASLYPVYLAMAGKPEANIRGLGISSSTARRLVSKFGGIAELQQAAEQGLLSSYPALIKESFSPPASFDDDAPNDSSSRGSVSGMQLLERNISLLKMKKMPSYASGQLQELVASYMSTPSTASSTTSTSTSSSSSSTSSSSSSSLHQDIIRLHPALHWHSHHNTDAVALLSAALASDDIQHSTEHITPEGFQLDLLLPQELLLQSTASSSSTSAAAAVDISMPWVIRGQPEAPAAADGSDTARSGSAAASVAELGALRAGNAVGVIIYSAWDLGAQGCVVAAGQQQQRQQATATEPAEVGSAASSAVEASADLSEVFEQLAVRLRKGGRLGRRQQGQLISSGGRNAARARSAGWKVVEVTSKDVLCWLRRAT